MLFHLCPKKKGGNFCEHFFCLSHFDRIIFSKKNYGAEHISRTEDWNHDLVDGRAALILKKRDTAAAVWRCVDGLAVCQQIFQFRADGFSKLVFLIRTAGGDDLFLIRNTDQMTADR